MTRATAHHRLPPSLAKGCSAALGDFLTDGQYYRAQVVDDMEANLRITLFEGFRYRIVACTADGAKVKYKIYDGGNNEVFSNEGVEDGTEWNFEIGATDDFVIKASLEGNTDIGCIVFEVGYDDEMWINAAP